MPSLTKLVIAVSLFLGALSAQAGPASLTETEVGKLRQLVQSSPEAAKWAQTLQRQAEEALASEPHPIGQIRTAGQLQGSDEKTRTQEALKDMSRLGMLGLGYALTGREDFRAKAVAYLLAWAKTCQPPPNPIDATNLEPLLEAYDQVRPTMSKDDQGKLDGWVRSVAQTLVNSDDPKKKTYWNNWKSHRLKIIGLSAFILNDKDLEDWTLKTYKTLLDKNLNPDGTTLDFLERDALHYQIYDLEPLIRLAILFERAQALDLYHGKTARGASLQNCVGYLYPFIEGGKKHAEYVHTQVKFDLERAQNHEKGHAIGENFEPKAALKCLELAQFFEFEMAEEIGKLVGKPGPPQVYFPTRQVLINEITRPQRLLP